MLNRVVLSGFTASFLGIIGACSAGGGAPSGAGGTGGSGVGNNAGTGAVLPTGGTTSSGSGGTGGTLIPIAGSQNINEGGAPPICDELSVVTTPLVPTVLLLVDNSSSMYEPRAELWDRLYDALMNPDTGAILPLESKVRFGLATFRSAKRTSVPETDPTCADMTSVPFALDNYDEIDAAYSAVSLDGRKPTGCGATMGPDCGELEWDTPTGHAIARSAAQLTAFTADPPGPKYILFVTDGTPNTCLVADPNCGQDVAIKAAQDAYAAGIGTFVIGMGGVLAESCAESIRCGADHMQDMANAGAGQPVSPQPMGFWYEQCATRESGTNPGTPTATYAPDEASAGTAPYFTASSSAELLTALTGLLNNVVSCTLDMDAIVTGNPTLGVVTVNGNPVPINDANGWILEPNNYQVTLQGTACETFKTVENSAVNIAFPCDPETGEPIAEPR